MRFRKKPVVIDADVWDLSPNALDFIAFKGWHVDDAKQVHIPTLEGTMIAKPGDWIIRGVNGEYYPCKPDIFAKTYELAEEDIIEALQKALEVGDSYPSELSEGGALQIEALPEFVELMIPGLSRPIKVKMFSDEEE